MTSKINHASALIVEDHLKHILSRKETKPFKTSDNKCLPKAHHSVFGNFSKDYFPTRTGGVKPLPSTENDEKMAAAARSKSQSIVFPL